MYFFIELSGAIISTAVMKIIIITKVTIKSFIYFNFYPPITNLPADIIIAIKIKNIKLTDITQDIINTNDFPAAAIELVILLSVIGSKRDAESLNIIDDNTILIMGYIIINITAINPIDPIAFFIINE